MPERARNLVSAGLLVIMAAVLVLLVATAPSDTDRVRSIGDRIRCPVCQGETIANSPTQMARDMMALVSERVSDGWSDEAIVGELLASYSGAVLLDPPARGSTLLLWVAPAVALGAGVAVILWWKRHPPETPAERPPERSRSRRLAPLLVLAGAFAVIVVVAGFFIQEREGPITGVANIAGQDLDDVSNETMEAVIAANADHPEVDGMRLALAERYYEEGEFRSAFPHYLAVAESENASGSQTTASLIRLGWMTWEGNAEATTALELFDQALHIDPDSTVARYLKAQVLWCGVGDLQAASDLLEAILADPELADDSRGLIEMDLAAISSGATCT